MFFEIGSFCQGIFFQEQAVIQARLGFHRYQMEAPDKVLILNIGEEMEKDRSYFAGRGVSDDFLDQVFQAGHGDIWFPSHAVLHEAGVTTGQ